MALYGNPFGGQSFVDSYFDYEPGAAYTAWMNSAPNQSYSFTNYLQSRFPTVYNQYKAASPYEPYMTFANFLRRRSPQDVYGSAPYQARGENPSAYAPRVRWVGF